MMEIWKPIKDYEDLYMINITGKIKSLNHNKSRILKQHLFKSGYLYVCLSKHSKCKWHMVHRLVAQTFIPNPDGLPEVNHKDENKTNNDISNLEWCNSRYNANYGTRNKRKSKPIQCIETGIIYWGVREMERQTGIPHNNIAKAIRNGTISGGYHWKYIEKEGGDNT